ncbi:hypothetical protein OTU49_002331 [Cherax quadricarinatus]|uniref:Serine/threonine-protein phosphatase CPPED1 n=1 Tax=Cherax quadricarinatus TaxID=27406 RepID=A0AAW0XPY0_CHEQU|nr:serine/threonine-protein phosphatase CPPED1-like [Cherax quadricarinatus]
MGEHFFVLSQNRQFLPFYYGDEKRWTEPFFFIQAADTQFGMQEKYMEQKEVYGWDQEIAWSKQMVKDINAMYPAPKFLVVCGDLLDAWPHTEPEIRLQQEVDFKKVFAGLKIPLVCVCGNHDIGNTPTPDTVGSYRSSFGDDFFSFWCGGVFFIVVNTQYYEDSSQCEDLAAEQEAWLDQQLEVVRREKPQHAIVFQHIPFFLTSPEEEKEYFNMAPALRQTMLDRFYDAGVRYIFCGHYHRNAGGFYKDMEEVVTSAVGAQLGECQQGFRLVKVLEDHLEHQYYNLGTAPTHIHLPNTKPSLPVLPTIPAWTRLAVIPAATKTSALAL